MSTNAWDYQMQPAVTQLCADCEDTALSSVGDNDGTHDRDWSVKLTAAYGSSAAPWGLTQNSGALPSPKLCMAWVPFPVLQNHGYIHWRLSGTHTQGATATSFVVRPITLTLFGADWTYASGFTETTNDMTFDIGSSAIASGFFTLDVKMDVVGDNIGTNRQIWKGDMVVYSPAGAILFNLTDSFTTTIDQSKLFQYIGLYLSAPATVPTTVVKSMVANHYNKRNGS